MLTLAAVARVLLYVGATIVTGRAVLAVQPGMAVRLRTSTPSRLLALGVLSLAFASAGLLESQRRAMEFPWAEVPTFVRESVWGQHWLQLTMVALTALALVFVTKGTLGRWIGVLVSAALATAMSGLGHSNADEQFPLLARALDALHVLAMGSWIGGLAFTVLIARADDHVLWRGMSRVATIAAPLAILSGAGSALRMLRAAPLEAMVASDYARLLVLKLVIALAIVGIGATQRRRVQRGIVPARTAVGQEMALAAVVMMVTAILTGTEPPG